MLQSFLQNILNALQWGSFYSLIALGYCLVYGVLLLINFAHGDIFMVGAYLAFFVSMTLLGKYGAIPGLPGWMVLLRIPRAMRLRTDRRRSPRSRPVQLPFWTPPRLTSRQMSLRTRRKLLLSLPIRYTCRITVG